jgi:hypothetical protein
MDVATGLCLARELETDDNQSVLSRWLFRFGAERLPRMIAGIVARGAYGFIRIMP